MWKHLPQPTVDLPKDLSSHHGHLINDEILHGSELLLQSMKLLSFQVFEVSLSWESKEGMQGVAINVESSHSSWCSHTDLISQEEPQAVDEVGLSSPCRARDDHPQWCGSIALGVAQDNMVGLQLLSLEMLRAG